MCYVATVANTQAPFPHSISMRLNEMFALIDHCIHEITYVAAATTD